MKERQIQEHMSYQKRKIILISSGPSPYVTIVQERAWIPWFCKVSWLSPFFNVGNSFFVAHRKVGSGATLPELESQVYLPTNLNIGQVL